MTASVLVDQLAFPESVRSHDGCIWFVDTPYVKVVTPDLRVRVHARLPTRLVLGLAFDASGAALAGDALGRRVYRAEDSGRLELFADLADWFPDCTNELVVTSDGALIVASMGFDVLHGATPRSSRLARVSPDGSVRAVGPELVFPNGMVLTGGGRNLVVAESFASRITMLAIDDDGELTGTGTFADLAGRECAHPDGICLDGDAVWYADPRAGAVVLVGEGGMELSRHDAGLPHPTSCVVEPESGDLVVSATARMPRGDLDHRNEGALLVVSR